MIVVLTAAAAIVLIVAALLALVRVISGPTMLNRAVALDVIVSILISVLGVEAAYNEHTTTVSIMLVLALVGFVGTVSVARFVGPPGSDSGSESGAPTTLGVDS